MAAAATAERAHPQQNVEAGGEVLGRAERSTGEFYPGMSAALSRMVCFIYVCMHVCIHIYACMHVCMLACMHACMYASMQAYIYVCMHASLYLCIYVSLYPCLFLSMAWTRLACVMLD